MTQSWAIDTLLPLAKEFYQSIEKQLGVALYRDLPVRRFFTNEGDQKRAARRIMNPRYKEYVSSILNPGDEPVGVSDALGSVTIEQGSCVDVPLFLNTLRNYFIEKGCFIEAEFQEADLIKKAEGPQPLWAYEGLDLEATHVVFCQGIHALENTYFENLPLIPIKGDILTVHLPNRQLAHGVYYKKRWLHAFEQTPEGALCRIGATYEEDCAEATPSPKAKEHLTESLEALLEAPLKYKVIKHASGIRPTTQDTRPLIVQHPEHPSLFAVNGLGSKGTSLAPLLSKALLDYFIDSKPLPDFDEDFK